MKSTKDLNVPRVWRPTKPELTGGRVTSCLPAVPGYPPRDDLRYKKYEPLMNKEFEL